jgi:hypothetical protein
MSANRRFRRQQERFKEKIHKQFLERTKHMTEDQLKEYVNKMVEKYAHLNEVAVINDEKERLAVVDTIQPINLDEVYGSKH